MLWLCQQGGLSLQFSLVIFGDKRMMGNWKMWGKELSHTAYLWIWRQDSNSRMRRYILCPWLQQVIPQGNLHWNYWREHHILPCIRNFSESSSKSGIRLTFFCFPGSNPNTHFAHVANVPADLAGPQMGAAPRSSRWETEPSKLKE